MKAVVIEDDAEVVEAVSMCFKLRWSGATVLSAGEGGKGLELIEAELPDIVILDLGLPDIDGLEVLRQIRLFSDMPIRVLTVRDQKIDIVRGLELGADDYITKPFDHVEFLARVKAVLRRSGMPQLRGSVKPFQSGNLWIDFDTQEVRLGGKSVKLSHIEYNLLC
jgi:two-component system KDP operon response regulator KdpE